MSFEFGEATEETWGSSCRECGRVGLGLDVTNLKKTGVHLGWSAEETWGSRGGGGWRGFGLDVTILKKDGEAFGVGR